VIDEVPVLLDTLDATQTHTRVAAQETQMAGYALFLAAIAVLGLSWVPRERRRIIERIPRQRDITVLDHCTGPGGNLPPLAKHLGPTARIVAFDLSRALARRAREVARRRGIRADVHQADALALPYADGHFDAVLHSGAINQFGGAKRRALDEIVRVTRPGGSIVIVDEGVERPASWRGRLLIARNPLFGSRPPVDLLPSNSNAACEWIMGGLFWQITFRTPQ
jgi:SAM-dependent methyltransferase